MVHLFEKESSPYKDELAKFEKLDFLGKDIDDKLIQNIASGHTNPETLEPFKNDENEKYLV